MCCVTQTTLQCLCWLGWMQSGEMGWVRGADCMQTACTWVKATKVTIQHQSDIHYIHRSMDKELLRTRQANTAPHTHRQAGRQAGRQAEELYRRASVGIWLHLQEGAECTVREPSWSLYTFIWSPLNLVGNKRCQRDAMRQAIVATRGTTDDDVVLR